MLIPIILSATYHNIAAEEFDYGIHAVWTDVESNYGDELVNPVIHENGMRTSQLTFDYETETLPDDTMAITAVYDGDGRLINVSLTPPEKNDSYYQAECSIKVPEAKSYSIKTMLWDSKLKSLSKACKWTDKEFRAINHYKVSKWENGTSYLRRATFENDTYDFFLVPNSFTTERTKEIVANSGLYSLKVSDRESVSSAIVAVADGVNRSAVVTVSCYVRNLEEDSSAVFYLQGSLPTESGEKKLQSARKTVSGADWTKLELSVDLSKYADITEDISFAVMTEGNTPHGYYADDFVISSTADGETYDDSEVKNPTLIKNTGDYTIRQAFENDTFGKIYLNSMADYYISSDVTAHTGNHYLNVTDRVRSDGTLLIYLNGIENKSTVYVECWIRNKDDKDVGYRWQAMLPTAEKNVWVNIGERVQGSYKGWKKVSGTLDLSKYTLTDIPMLQLVAGSSGILCDFLVDDLTIKADTQGEFYDDTHYTPPKKDESLSATPNSISAEYKLVEMDIPSLKDVYKDYFKIGACVPNSKESDTSRYGSLLKKHFNSVVSNGYFNMVEILPDPTKLNAYDFSKADKLMDFAVRNGIDDIAGHCLIWETGSLKPHCRTDGTSNGSLMDRNTMLTFMKEYITKVITHFEGDGNADEYTASYDTKDDWHINVWNVVNEAVESVDGSGSLQYVNQGAFVNVLGEEYVEYAFKYADETGYEDIALRYNDYDEHRASKAKGIYTLVKKLLDENIRVDSIGIQSHYKVDDDISELRNSLNLFSSLGVKLDVTELDVQAYSGEQLQNGVTIYEDGIPKDVEFKQARLYEELFGIYKEYSDSIDRVTFWSVDDRYSYFNKANFTKTEYAGIFDRDFTAKPQYWAVADADELRSRYPDYKNGDLFWDFEVESDITADTAQIGKWTYAVAIIGDESKKLTPRIKALSDVEKTCEFGSTRAYTKDTEYKGSDIPSAGSTYCAEIPNDPSAAGNAPFLYFNGMKVNLSNKQLVPGEKYKMTFYVANNHTSRGIYTKLLPEGTPDYFLSRDKNVSWITANADIDSDALSTTKWRRQEIILSPQQADFNDSGYTSLYLMFARNSVYGSDGKIKEICPGEMFYVDDIRIEKIVSEPNMQWTFTNNTDYSPYPALGKWTWATRDDHNGYNMPQTELLYHAERKNKEYIKYNSSYGSTDTETGWPPPTYRIAAISNAYTYGGVRNWPAKMGMKLKLSKEQIVPGKEYEMTFYAMTNDAPKGMYLKLMPFSGNEASAYYESSAKIPWIDIYEDTDNDGVGDGKATVAADCILRQHWQRFSVSVTPEESDFDSKGYTDLWLIAAPEALRYKDGSNYKTATITPGTKIYIDDIEITEAQ